MKTSSTPRLATLLVCLVLPSVAFAQRSITLTQVRNPGETTARVVMDEVSELTFDVRNTSNNNTQLLNEIYIVLPNTHALLESPTPTGWMVSYFDAPSRTIAFARAGVTCGSGNYGLRMNETVRFTLRTIASQNTADQTAQRFAAGTVGRDTCLGGNFTASNLTNAASQWVRSTLYAQVTALPRVLPIEDDITARIILENRSSSNTTIQNITGEGPTSNVGLVSFEIVELQPANFTVSLPARGAGILSARVTTLSGGELVAYVRGRNSGNTIASQVAATPMVNVGALPAALDVDALDAFAGETVRVRMTITNPSTTNTYLNVTPRAPVLRGTSGATLVSGPTPASAARLSPGTSAHFIWTYQLTGAEFSDYIFDAQADATLNGSAVTTSLVSTSQGHIVSHRVRANPSALVSGTTAQTVVYTVQNRGQVPLGEVRLIKPAANYFTVSNTIPAVAGWSVNNSTAGITWESNNDANRIPVGGERAFTVTYTAVTAVTANTPFRHRVHLATAYNSGSDDRIETPMTVVSGTAPEVERFTAVAREGSVTLNWDNPSMHNGVVVLRAANAAPNTVPVAGRTYAAGATLGNATVVYADAYSAVSSFEDTSVTNGTTYYYRVFNADDVKWYSAGNRPTSAALVATPRARAGGPLWCYSVGLDARQQPITELGVGVFSAFNDSVVANVTQVTNPALDGAERWRPLPLSGLIGSRFPVVPLRGLPGQYILVGDQSGVGYAINTATGVPLWRWDNNGAPIGTIQSFPVSQLYDYANAAYQAARPNTDLVFFATRLSNASQNRVVALNAATGALVFTYRPGDLGMVSGGMLVDYANNRLYVGAKTHAGSQSSLRILNTLTGAEVGRLSLGDIELSLVRNAVTNQVLVSNSDGVVHAIDLATMQPAWNVTVSSRASSSAPPAFTSFSRPQGGGFMASLASGRVEFWDNAGSATTPPVRKWSTVIANPSGTFSLNRGGVVRLYAGGADGKVHVLDFLNGADLQQITLGSAQLVGTPTIDTTVSRLHVGSQDGRICAFPVPFP
ncbi:PQQ-binding-like beta-propeller repeat protein [Myxococcus sp. K15C18031901]|uniref:outer membrane protein assembly factor BamB family protein n=1 Tax=Myxococcus dinghuensis TaxID=2906761 RepID=UPI0020A7D667|nr:PQQ-binding-like beta-propeller repeat protein [Myxococcus dinghuensis]MCP3099372.1 PQQ-binding-like beta-propeller repeat protein [Myxococcus dinghuensis]